MSYDNGTGMYSAAFRVDFLIPAENIKTANYKYYIELSDDVVIPETYLNRTYIAKDGDDKSFDYMYVNLGNGKYAILIDYDSSYVDGKINNNEEITSNFVQFNALIEKVQSQTETEQIIAVTDELNVSVPDAQFEYPENENKYHDIHASKAFTHYTIDSENKIHVFYTAHVGSTKGTDGTIHVTDVLTTGLDGNTGYSNNENPAIESVSINTVSPGGTASNVKSNVEGDKINLEYDLPALEAGKSYDVTYEYVYDKAYHSNPNDTNMWVKYTGSNSLTVVTGTDPITDHGSGSYEIIKTNKPVEINKNGSYKESDGQIEWTITVSFSDQTKKGPYQVSDEQFKNIVSESLEITNANGESITLIPDSNGVLTFPNAGEYTIKYKTVATASSEFSSTFVSNKATGSNEDFIVTKESSVTIPATGTFEKTLVSGTESSSGSDGNGRYNIYTLKWHVCIPIPDDGFPQGTTFKEVLSSYVRGGTNAGNQPNHYMTYEQQNALLNAFKNALNLTDSTDLTGVYSSDDNNKTFQYVTTLNKNCTKPEGVNFIEFDYETTGKLYLDGATVKTSSSNNGDDFTNTLYVNDINKSAKWEYSKLIQKKARVNNTQVDGSSVEKTVTRSGDRTLTWDVVIFWDGDYNSAQIVDTLPEGLRLKQVAVGGEYNAVDLYRSDLNSNTYQPMRQDNPGYDGLGNSGYSNWGNVYGDIKTALGTNENNRIWPVATVTGDPKSGQTIYVDLSLTGQRPDIFSAGKSLVVRITAYVEDDQFTDFTAFGQNETAHTIRYTNTAKLWTNGTERGSDTQTQKTTLESDILKKGETHYNFKSNHDIHYVLDINKDGHRLIPENSDLKTLTLEDYLSYSKAGTNFDFTVNLNQNSVKLYEYVNGSWKEYDDSAEPWVYTFEETSDPNNSQVKIKKLIVKGIPDQKILQLRYDYTIDVSDHDTSTKYKIPDIINKAILKGEGYTSSSTEKESENISFETSAGTTSAKHLKIVKVDSENNRQKLQNARFILEQYTNQGWEYVPAFVNGSRMSVGSWNGQYVYVTNKDGILEISQPTGDSATKFQLDVAYRLREVEAPAGYQLDESNAPMAFFYLSNTATSGSDIAPTPPDALWAKKADNLLKESDSMWVGNTKSPELIITKSVKGEKNFDEVKGTVSFAISGPDNFSRTIQLNDSGWTWDSTNQVYVYRISENIKNNTTYHVVENNTAIDDVARKTTYCVNSRPAQSGEEADVLVRYGTGKVDYTNVYGETEIVAVKVWNDRDNADGRRPASIELRLLKNGEDMGDAYAKSLNEQNNWRTEWTGLDAAETYTVAEVSVDGYVSKVSYTQNDVTVPALTADGTVTITNKLTSVYVEKVWDPAVPDSSSGIVNVKVKIQRRLKGSSGNWEEIPRVDYQDVSTITLSSDNQWKGHWDNLDDRYDYKVTELTNLTVYKTTYKVNGGTASETAPEAVQMGDKVEVVNKKLKGITVKKVWLGGNPSEIKVKIERYTQNQWQPGYGWGSEGNEVKLNTDNDWMHTWSGLENGYQYRVTETNVANGCKVVYEVQKTDGTKSDDNQNLSLGDNVTVYNISGYGSTGIDVYKEWDGVPNDKQKDVTVDLYKQQGEVTNVCRVTVNVRETQETYFVKPGSNISIAPDGLHNCSCNPIQCTGVNNTCDWDGQDTIKATINSDCNITITPQTWAESDFKKFELKSSTPPDVNWTATPEKMEGRSVTLNSGNSWHASWIDLAQFNADGKTAYRYTVKESEESAAGYEVSYSQNNSEGIQSGIIIVTNKDKPAPAGTSFDIVKVDKDDKHQLSGAVFKLMQGTENVAVSAAAEGVTDVTIAPKANGKTVTVNDNTFTVPTGGITVANLPDGTYKLVEITPPEGYVIENSEPAEFTVSNGQITTRTLVDGLVTYQSNTFTVNNAKGVTLPHTGSIGTAPFTITGALLTAGAVLMLSAYTMKQKRTPARSRKGTEHDPKGGGPLL